MIIKKYLKKKKLNFNNFLKFYFIISILLIISFFSIFFNTGVWINNKSNFLNKLYFNGLNHYLNIGEIAYKGFKGFFLDYEEISIDLPYEELIILEKNRKEIITTSVNGMRSANQEFTEGQNRTRLLIKGDEKISILGIGQITPNKIIECHISRKDFFKKIKLRCRIDTLKELEYFKAGGILQFVLNSIISKAS